jgi:hypothetical protein
MVDTGVAEEPASAAPPRKPRKARRRWRTLWFVAPALFLVLLGVARIVYWRTSVAYAPLRVVSAGAPAAGQSASVRSTRSGFLVSGPAGCQRVFHFHLNNHGMHPVDINRIQPTDDAVAQVRWAANRVQDGRRVPSPSHALPVHVPRNAIVNIELTVTKPVCTAGTARYLSGAVTIHWHSMISPHATKLDLLTGHPQRIALCATR